ncbi:hypothetical protein FOCC_FOCC005128, partial [Frankliniella occidentalis]
MFSSRLFYVWGRNISLEFRSRAAQASEDFPKLMSVKRAFNHQFGSVFRSGNNSSYFFRKLHRLSDIYTADLTNLLNYSSDHLFYPRLNVMPHDYNTVY